MSPYFVLLVFSYFYSILSMPITKSSISSGSDLDGSYLFDLSNSDVPITSRSDITKLLFSDNVSDEDNIKWQHRNDRRELLRDPKKLIYLAKYLECAPNCPVDRKINDKLNQLMANIGDDRILSKIISWTNKQLENLCGLNAGGSYSGVNIWNSVNLTGKREGPLYVEEPHYILIRREEIEPKFGSNYDDDPFIPPRGRKHLSTLSDLFSHHYELFVPNRGKKDKIGDIFKYDDLFFPNRGKKQATAPPFKYIKSNENTKYYINCEESNDKCCKLDSQQYVGNGMHSLNNKEINYLS